MEAKEQLIRAALDAWNRRDLESIAPLLTDDFEWVEWTDALIDASAGRRGVAAVEGVTADLDEGWESYRAEPVEYHDVDEQRALVIMAESAHGPASGVPISSRFGYVVSVRGAKIARVEAYRDPEAARKAVERG